MENKAEDPYLKIPPQAFARTFDELLARKGCSAEQRSQLMAGKVQFNATGSKQHAMQALLSAYPQDVVVLTMQAHVHSSRVPGPSPAVAPPAPAPAATGAWGPQTGPSGGGLTPQQQQILAAQQRAMLVQQQQQQARAMLPPQPPQQLRPPAALSNQTTGLPVTAMPPNPAVPTLPGAGAAKRPHEGGGNVGGDGSKPGGGGKGGAVGPGGEEEEEVHKDADMLADVGFTLEEEERALKASSKAGTRQTRSMRDVGLPRHLAGLEPLINSQPLVQLMQRAAARSRVASVDPACVPYLAQAVEAHMARLLTAVARVATQRIDPARRYSGTVPEPRRRRATPDADGDAQAGTVQPAQQQGTTEDGAKAPADVAPAAGPPQPGGAGPPRPTKSHQSMLVFRRTRPLLVKMELLGDAGVPLVGTHFAGLTRPLEPTTLLSPPASAVAASSAAVGARTQRDMAPEAVPLVLQDLVSALERDTLLSKHPLVWRLHQKLAMAGSSTGSAGLFAVYACLPRTY